MTETVLKRGWGYRLAKLLALSRKSCVHAPCTITNRAIAMQGIPQSYTTEKKTKEINRRRS